MLLPLYKLQCCSTYLYFFLRIITTSPMLYGVLLKITLLHSKISNLILTHCIAFIIASEYSSSLKIVCCAHQLNFAENQTVRDTVTSCFIFKDCVTLIKFFIFRITLLKYVCLLLNLNVHTLIKGPN